MLRAMQRGQQFTTIFTIVTVSIALSACQSVTPTTLPTPAKIESAERAPVDMIESSDEIQDDTQRIETAVAPEPPPEATAPDSTTLVAESISDSEDLWARLRNGFALHHHLDHPRVQSEIRWYQKHPNYLKRVVQRAQPHLHFIVGEIESAGLPGELALLPIVESAYDPFAYSHGRAAGIWQIIPGTARHLGLKSNYWYDGRRDIPDATDAALRYLAALHRSLDKNWLLALAAYNNGEGNVRRAMRKNRRAGRPEDFFDLKLNAETTGYVPRLLAISAVVASPEQYGVTLPAVLNKPHWMMVNVESQIDVATAAELMEISAETIYKLNPGLNQWSTPPAGPHRLVVPIPHVSRLLSGLHHLAPADRVAWRRHVVKSGETLGEIAVAHGTTVRTLQQSNNITGHVIVPGQSLMIPTASQPSAAYSLSQSERLKRTQDRLQTTHGQPLRHRVVRGDTLWDLSMKYDVSVRSLAKWNGKAPRDLLLPGEELLLFGLSQTKNGPQAPKTPSTSPTDAAPRQTTLEHPLGSASAVPPNQRNVMRKINYRVRSGESLASIASRFRVTVARILEWNQHLANQRYIHPGDPITLYVDVTSAH
ncbi:MAG: LysM peptidoglycan-binding domain-containing protein [Pseudomonadota bacterium]